MRLEIAFFEKQFSYRGPELRPHFLLTEFGLRGSAIGSWVGPCDVATGELVDWEDRLSQDSIKAESMIHFIGEFFGISLNEGVLMQRLFMATARDVLSEALKVDLIRSGDDLFYEKKKMSVSIVTASPVSKLLHVGINWNSKGAPVEAIGIGELTGNSEIELQRAKILSLKILSAFQEEISSVEWACAKVRPVM